jgi:hypothetical protein
MYPAGKRTRHDARVIPDSFGQHIENLGHWVRGPPAVGVSLRAGAGSGEGDEEDGFWGGSWMVRVTRLSPLGA